MRWICTVTLSAVALLPALGLAAQKPSKSSSTREAFYRCRDAGGQTHYGDSVPPQCAGLDTEVLNEHGMTLRVIEGDRSRAARAEREVAEAKTRKERDARLLHDRTLIETFLSVEDIERLRDQRLELLTAQYRVTEQNIANLRERQARLERQIARFKPYNDKPGAPPLPDHLGEEMVNTVNSLQVYERSLLDNRREQTEVKSSFASDVKRFKELKGIK